MEEIRLRGPKSALERLASNLPMSLAAAQSETSLLKNKINNPRKTGRNI
jgi:hypothetical protein